MLRVEKIETLVVMSGYVESGDDFFQGKGEEEQ